MAPRSVWTRADGPTEAGTSEESLLRGRKDGPPYRARLERVETGGASILHPRLRGHPHRGGERLRGERRHRRCPVATQGFIALQHPAASPHHPRSRPRSRRSPDATPPTRRQPQLRPTRPPLGRLRLRRELEQPLRIQVIDPDRKPLDRLLEHDLSQPPTTDTAAPRTGVVHRPPDHGRVTMPAGRETFAPLAPRRPKTASTNGLDPGSPARPSAGLPDGCIVGEDDAFRIESQQPLHPGRRDR